MGLILPSHLAGTRRVGVWLPASRIEIPVTSPSSTSKLLGQDMQHKGSPCVYFGGFIGGGGVTLAFHPAVWKRAGPGAVSDLIPQTWHGLPSSEMSPRIHPRQPRSHFFLAGAADTNSLGKAHWWPAPLLAALWELQLGGRTPLSPEWSGDTMS